MKKINRIKTNLISTLEIPYDLAEKNPVISMVGKKQLFIENYRFIQQYHSDCLILQTHTGKIKILGKNLEIISYNAEEMYVQGNISSIYYE